MPEPTFSPWTPEEHQVIGRFVHAVVEGRYRYVKEAVPDCRRELRRIAPAQSRTDVAVAWKVPCLDFGLPRRKHRWSREQLRLVQRLASALARGEAEVPASTVGARPPPGEMIKLTDLMPKLRGDSLRLRELR